MEECLTSYLPDDEQHIPDWLRPRPSPRSRDAQSRRGIVRWRRPGSHQAPWSRQPAAPTPGSIAAVLNDIEQCGPELSRLRAGRWGRQLFTPQDVRAWLAVGLKSDDLDLVVELRSLGVPPEAMAWVVRKETVLDRIRVRHYSARDIARLLRREGLLPHRSA